MTEQQTAPHAEAVSDLVDERYGQLVGYARKRLAALDVPSAWVDAEDVVQNALESVLARAEPVEKPRPYVFAVIRNEVRHAARRYRSGLGYGSRAVDVQLEAAGPAVDSCGTADLRLDLEAALNTLPPQQRTAVLCTKALKLTQAQTAQVMGRSPGTVAAHVSRAVVTLKLALGALALVLVGCAVQWLRSGMLPIEPAASGDVGKATLFLPWQWWSAAVIALTALGAALVTVGAQRQLRLRTGRTEEEQPRRRVRSGAGTSPSPEFYMQDRYSNGVGSQ
ncbi:sigma-70 family RNA polymerase sigma factor [Streptomyces chiangmaiensis]|uniref:Sigma-70 family RNA polymerase sigma factor n=1 Tax=Streptomyces chiangmaiensis TaxID=766497 RepID=A0ABU7FWX7_9ACTN|nr:sigma-70 family RNA polymerase sigma factor [Streptomyces chiangmaiensis]MED7828448.1 sigma-70 family RNA polymerase sigma factor [Streptomyces chiangmaiensis]